MQPVVFFFKSLVNLGILFATPPSIVGGEHIKGRGTKIDFGFATTYLHETCQPITQRSQEHDAFTGFLRVKSFNLNQQKVHQVRYLQYGCIFKASFQRVKAFKPETSANHFNLSPLRLSRWFPTNMSNRHVIVVPPPKKKNF